MPEDSSEPKISLAEAIFVGMLIAIPDLIQLIMLFFGLDDFWIVDAFAFPATQFYFWTKGMRTDYILMANVLDLIPYVGDLPMRSVAFWSTVWLEHHPKAKAVVEKVATVATAGEAKAAGMATAASEATAAEGGVAAAGSAAEKGVAAEGRAEAPRTRGPRAAEEVGEGGAPSAEREEFLRRDEKGGEEAAPQPEEKEEAKPFGEEPLEEIKRSMEESGAIEELKESLSQPSGGQKRGVSVDDENNQVDLRQAA